MNKMDDKFEKLLIKKAKDEKVNWLKNNLYCHLNQFKQVYKNGAVPESLNGADC